MAGDRFFPLEIFLCLKNIFRVLSSQTIVSLCLWKDHIERRTEGYGDVPSIRDFLSKTKLQGSSHLCFHKESTQFREELERSVLTLCLPTGPLMGC